MLQCNIIFKEVIFMSTITIRLSEEQKKAIKDAHRKAYGRRYQEGLVKIYDKR